MQNHWDKEDWELLKNLVTKYLDNIDERKVSDERTKVEL